MNYISAREREMVLMADFVYRILSFKVIGQPGCACIEILKDRHNGEHGVKIINVVHMPAGLLVK